MFIELMMPSNHLILCVPILLLSSIFHSRRVFSSELALCIRWPKYWSFSFSISPSYEYSGLISIRIDWFDLLAVQETLKSLLQHHSSKASILWWSVVFMVQLSSVHDYWRKHSFDWTDICRQSDILLSGHLAGLRVACRFRGSGSSSPGRHSRHTGLSPLGAGCHSPITESVAYHKDCKR